MEMEVDIIGILLARMSTARRSTSDSMTLLLEQLKVLTSDVNKIREDGWGIGSSFSFFNGIDSFT